MTLTNQPADRASSPWPVCTHCYVVANLLAEKCCKTHKNIDYKTLRVQTDTNSVTIQLLGKNMKTQVEFRSSKFPPYDGEEEEINPGLWGKRLTEYLAKELGKYGIETEEMAIEDWGCYLPIRNDGYRLALCCGHQDGDDDQFLVFTEPSKPKVKKLFRTIDATPQLSRLLDAVRAILETDSEIREITWTEPI